jgi:hypothetical protein
MIARAQLLVIRVQCFVDIEWVIANPIEISQQMVTTSHEGK